MSRLARVFEGLKDGKTPLEILVECLGVEDPKDSAGNPIDDQTAHDVLVSYLSRFHRIFDPPQRDFIKSIGEVMDLFRKAQHIVVIIGAGASLGPDFRSPGGLYDTIAKEGALDDPYKVFDIACFQQDPTIFWRFASMIFPSLEPEHSGTHYFLAELEKRGKLLRVYSQNVDTLEIGIPNEKLRCVHGSWRQNMCMSCGAAYDMEFLRPLIDKRIVPKCPICEGLIKPGIVFFGERTNIEDEDIDYDAEHGDLLLVIGTSLQVAPVSFLPQRFWNVPAVLINREPVTCSFNAELLGQCDNVCTAIETELGWKESDKNAESFVFAEPNKFVFSSGEDFGPSFTETGRDVFLVTPALAGLGEAFD